MWRLLSKWTIRAAKRTFVEMNRNDEIFGHGSSRRVLAWWDLDVHIGEFHKRKFTARPLRDLERLLGHRLHVEDWMRYNVMPDGVWKFEAFNYIDTTDPALAAYATLKKLGTLSDWFGMSCQGYNTAATALTDDPDEATICAFYWSPPDQFGLQRYQSSGVLLRFDDLNSEPFDARDRYNRAARPIVGVPTLPNMRSDFMVEFSVHIVCGNKQDLLSFHWPRFQEAKWPDGVSDFEVDAKTHSGRPNVIRVRQVLRGVREHEAVAHCLSYAPSFRIKLDTGPDFHFVGQRQLSRDYSDGIVAFDMKRFAG